MSLADIKGKVQVLARQVGHLSDGRWYTVQVMEADAWVDFLAVGGTNLCDGAATLLRTNGFRARGMPRKGP